MDRSALIFLGTFVAAAFTIIFWPHGETQQAPFAKKPAAEQSVQKPSNPEPPPQPKAKPKPERFSSYELKLIEELKGDGDDVRIGYGPQNTLILLIDRPFSKEDVRETVSVSKAFGGPIRNKEGVVKLWLHTYATVCIAKVEKIKTIDYFLLGWAYDGDSYLCTKFSREPYLLDKGFWYYAKAYGDEAITKKLENHIEYGSNLLPASKFSQMQKP